MHNKKEKVISVICFISIGVDRPPSRPLVLSLIDQVSDTRISNAKDGSWLGVLLLFTLSWFFVTNTNCQAVTLLVLV